MTVLGLRMVLMKLGVAPVALGRTSRGQWDSEWAMNKACNCESLET
jgi:hypothetical protein